MSYFTRNMDKCSRLHSFPVTRYTPHTRPKSYYPHRKPPARTFPQPHREISLTPLPAKMKENENNSKTCFKKSKNFLETFKKMPEYGLFLGKTMKITLIFP